MLNCHALNNWNGIADGVVVIDGDGEQWQYSTKLNTWSRIGTYISVPVVTETVDGLVSPDIFSRVSAISKEVQNGLNFNFLKIYPHTAGYYYLFQSSNHTIIFEPESANDLRIEVSRPRLLSLLSQLKCPGDRGVAGIQGVTGIAGTPGQPEVKYAATMDGIALIIDATATSTIDTPISLRIFKNNSTKSSLTILQPINDDHFIVVYSDVVLSADSFLNYDRVTSNLSGRLISDGWAGNNWYYKANETGRKGPQGVNGSGFFEIVENNFVDDTVEAIKAVVSLRYSGLKSSVYYFADTLFLNNCVSKLALLHACVTTNITAVSKISDLSLAAVQSTTNICKNIARFQFIEKQLIAPTLEFVEWTPIEACWTQHMANQFGWKDFTPASIVDSIWRTDMPIYNRWLPSRYSVSFRRR